jgi:broad specificity phosphatase PhoE
MARIMLIAHTATEEQRNAAFPSNGTISETRKINAMAWNIPRAERVWTAPEGRTQETARLLGLEATEAAALRDCDYGRWSGRRMDEVQRQDPEGILAWLTDPGAAPHGGESIDEMIARVGCWLDDQRKAQSTVAVTHPAVIRAALVYALRIPATTFWRFDIAPLTLTDLRFSREIWTLRCNGCVLQTMTNDAISL